MSVLLLIGATLPLRAAAPRYAIRAGKILTMAAQVRDQDTPRVVNHGIILISNGKIEAIGSQQDVNVPQGYAVIDADHLWVMPGIIEAHTHIGADMGDLNDMVMQVNPELRASDCVWPDDIALKHALKGGVTTIHTMPGSGTNQAGFTVIVKTDTADPGQVLREFGAMKATQAFNPERRTGDLGRTRMGMSWLLRQFMNRAQAYHEAWLAYEQGKTETKPAFKPQWENLRRLFAGDIPVIVHTYDGWGVMQTARMFAGEYKLKTIATHTAYAGHLVASDVAKYKNVYINIGPRVLDFYRSPGIRQSARNNRFYGMGAQYAKGGVSRLSINTDAVGWGHWMAPQEELPFQATMSARLGLDELTALAAVTINPALALGIDERVGSLEVGKDADIVIKQSSLLDPSTPVDMVLISGRIVYQRKDTNLLKESPS